ncbi:uncharacterized protein E0L32_007905 [Thyridium curvatum]|uniref:Alpha/beta hydrolase fold-3 domain-containing protein n=1 Tax=Thyridium curvatum TaxID=1093900 RepID=A0A507AXK8_9PEZI|nr:uncharacterized protein E0L32_007905 [Thyridium curvatum]TPX11486.1 hypothetical protein E0L32_007905 [Thyridium curvatum]
MAPPISMWDGVLMLGSFCLIATYQLYESVMVIFRDTTSTRSYSHELRNRVSHAVCAWLSSKQLRALFKPTQDALAEACKKDGVLWHAEDIPDGMGSKLHWFGNLEANKLILYFHGGGYSLPADHGHIRFVVECQRRLEVEGHNVSVVMLEYGLAPESRYPVQPSQALAALQHVLNKGFLPSDIIVGGDSAGGNLALALLSLVNHPVESLPTVKLHEPIRGVFLISPWVSFSTQSLSFQENADRDLINARLILDWGEAYAPSPLRDEYSEPLRAGISWWEQLPTQDLLILAGEVEVFRDDIVELGNRMSHANVQTKLIVCPKHSHEECIQDAKSKLQHGMMAESVWNWLVARYSN